VARKDLSEAFLRTTVDQLITLVDLHELSHTHEVAKRRNRDQSSILKQLATLNASFAEECGERLVNAKTGRGKPVQFTETGVQVVELARSFLKKSEDTFEDTRSRLGEKLTAASTTGMLSAVSAVWPKWKESTRMGFELQIKQIRTYEVKEYLNGSKADLVFAGKINHPKALTQYEDFEFLEWKRSRVVLLSNHTNLPSVSVHLKDIVEKKVLMILPDNGIIKEFAEVVFGEDFRRLTVAARINDLYFGIDLLKHNVYEAAMLVIEEFADSFIREQEGSGNCSFYKYEIPEISEITISGVVFRRRDSERFSSSHPVNVCWEVFKKEAAEG